MDIPPYTPETLTTRVCQQIRRILFFQKVRWAQILQQQEHTIEHWWKGEICIALQRWCCRTVHPYPVWVDSEVKPSDCGVSVPADLNCSSVDVLVGRWCPTSGTIFDEPPRVFIELKIRGTWWGRRSREDRKIRPRQALKEFKDDLRKWNPATWNPDDVVIGCLISTHDAIYDTENGLPQVWDDEINRIADQFPRVVISDAVSYRLNDKERIVNRFARVDFCVSHAPWLQK